PGGVGRLPQRRVRGLPVAGHARERALEGAAGDAARRAAGRAAAGRRRLARRRAPAGRRARRAGAAVHLVGPGALRQGDLARAADRGAAEALVVAVIDPDVPALASLLADASRVA